MQMLKTLGAMLLVVMTGSTALADTWDVDDSHSQANFKVKHLMISNVHGKVTGIKGKVEFDGKDLSKATVDVTLDPATVDTGNAKRDEHLKGPDFLDVAKMPAMSFKSKKIEKSKGGFTLTGDLTMHGVTKSVTMKGEGPTAEMKDPWGNMRRGLSATAKVSRKDFGLTWNKALESGGVVVGDELDITIEMEIMKAGKK